MSSLDPILGLDDGVVRLDNVFTGVRGGTRDTGFPFASNVTAPGCSRTYLSEGFVACARIDFNGIDLDRGASAAREISNELEKDQSRNDILGARN